MAKTLSPSAIHRIIFLVENDDRPTCTRAGLRSARRLAPRNALPGHWNAAHELQHVNSKWKAVYILYDIEPQPPLHYLSSLELSLVLKGEVDDEDVRAIFAHEKPLEFWGCPRRLVPKIVEAFLALRKEPECLDVTITALFGFGVMEPSEAWPLVYTSHLPCYACTTVETVEERCIPRLRDPDMDDPDEAVDFAVEKFHVSPKNSAKHLTVELHCKLEPGATETEREQSSVLHKITIRLTDKSCSPQGRLFGAANRSSATSLLLPEFASDVFGCLERAHVGSTLLASRGLHNLICQLKQRLPVHYLKCAFEQEMAGRCMRRLTGAYWLVIRHFQRDLSYTDVRRFKMPSTARGEDDSALIRQVLSNSHMIDLVAPCRDFPFAIKMLASLAARNFSVGRVELCAETQRLSDYRSMEAVFGGLRMGALHLRCEEYRFIELVKTTDFFRIPTFQKLRELKLTLDFERGSIDDIVAHFQFESTSSRGTNYAFNRNNLLVSGMKVEGKRLWDRISNFIWDVYRFRNATTNDYLTACVGRAYRTRTILHLMKGEVYPDASFADY